MMVDSNEIANPAGFIWYQDGYEIKEVFIDGTLNIIMRKARIIPARMPINLKEQNDMFSDIEKPLKPFV